MFTNSKNSLVSNYEKSKNVTQIIIKTVVLNGQNIKNLSDY